MLTGRRPILLSALVLATGLLLAISITGNPQKAWELLHVRALTPSFADTITFTYQIDCAKMGHDPYHFPACDPWNRPYNYPRPWLWLGALGVSPASTNYIGVAFAVATYFAMAILFSTRTILGGLFALATAISPPILFGVERGNNDQIVFAILVIAFFSTSHRTAGVRTGLRSALIVFLAILKLYPVAAIAFVCRSFRGSLTAIGVAIVSAILVWLTTGANLADIAANTPSTEGISFGYLVLPLKLEHSFLGPKSTAAFVSIIARLAAFTILAAAILWGAFHPEHVQRVLPAVRDDWLDDVAIAGASIFVLVFLIGTSFDYRLIFLTCVQASSLRYYEDSPHAWKRLIMPIAILVFMWTSASDMSENRLFAIVGEILDWLLFALFSAWLAQRIWPVSEIRGWLMTSKWRPGTL
jgi:hypothetical protein